MLVAACRGGRLRRKRGPRIAVGARCRGCARAQASTSTLDEICEQTVKKVHDMFFFSGCREYTYIDTYLYLYTASRLLRRPSSHIFFSPAEKKKKQSYTVVIVWTNFSPVEHCFFAFARALPSSFFYKNKNAITEYDLIMYMQAIHSRATKSFFFLDFGRTDAGKKGFFFPILHCILLAYATPPFYTLRRFQLTGNDVSSARRRREQLEEACYDHFLSIHHTSSASTKINSTDNARIL